MKMDANWIRRVTTYNTGEKWLASLPTQQRFFLARAVPELDDELSLKLCTFLVKDQDPAVRAEVALGLGEIGHRTTVYAAESITRSILRKLQRLAGDKDWFVRARVPQAALQYGSDTVMPIVLKLTDDKIKAVRDSAGESYETLRALHPFTAAKLAGGLSSAAVIEADKSSPSLGRFWSAPMILHLSTHGALLDEAATVSAGTATTGAATAGVSSVNPAGDGGAINMGGGGGGNKDGDGGEGDGGGGGGGDHGRGGRDDERNYLDLQSGSRFVNSWFDGHPDPLQPLEYRRQYKLSIEVAPEPRVNSFTTGDPSFKEPQFEGKDSIEITVAIVSDDFEIAGKAARRMMLNRDQSERTKPVSFDVTPTKNNQSVFIHVFFYYQNNLFHEAIISALVLVQRHQDAQATTAPFKPVPRYHAPVQGPRDVNLQVVEDQGTYRLVLFYDFGGDDYDILSCVIKVNRDRIVDLLAGVRQGLLEVVNTVVTSPGGKQRKVYFDGEPPQVPIKEMRLPHLLRIDDDIYQRSLRSLARAGSRLYVNLFESASGSEAMGRKASEFGKKLRELSGRQALRLQVISDEFFIPWNLLFDGELHQEKIDPLKFWGFRHLIEEVPGSSRAERIDPIIPVRQKPMRMALNVNVEEIPSALTTPLRAAFKAWAPAIDPIERLNEQDVLAALQGGAPQGEIEYFYCHAGVAGASHTYFDQSYLGLTKADQGLTLEDIKIAMIQRKAFDSQPLVFLNACESGRMDGRFYDGFVPQFLKMGARVVLGTDCEVPSLVGAHFGTQFLLDILKGHAVGDAILARRKSLLEQYQNPLGLIYRVFGNAETKLSNALI